MLLSEKFHCLNTARTIPTRSVFQRPLCRNANTNLKSMVFNVIFIRFKVSINSTAAAPRLSLRAVFHWLRLCHCLKRFKVTALKKKGFFSLLSYSYKYKSLCCPRERIDFFFLILSKWPVWWRGLLQPRQRQKSLLWKDYSTAWKTALELQNPQGPRVLFFSVCFQDTCFNMSLTQGREGDIHVGQREAPWEFGGGGSQLLFVL